MARDRSDKWTKVHDEYLTGVVLEYIATGKTQLAAFELVGEKINRTPEACGFRWNSDLRHRYPGLIEQAKKQRLVLKKEQNKSKRKQEKAKKLEEKLPGYRVTPADMVSVDYAGRVTPVQKVVDYDIRMTSKEVEALASMFNRNKVPVELMQLRKDINKILG